MQLFPCSCDNTFIVLAFKIPLILTIYGHVGGNLISFISCNFTPFYPIEMGFSLYIFFLCSKNVCNVLNTALQVFNVVTKNRRHLWRHTFKKHQKYLYNGKNWKKIFLQLRCFNVLLHLKYKILLREPKVEFTKLRVEKPQQPTIVL